LDVIGLQWVKVWLGLTGFWLTVSLGGRSGRNAGVIRSAQNDEQQQRQQQIPFGDDKQKDNGNNKSNGLWAGMGMGRKAGFSAPLLTMKL